MSRPRAPRAPGRILRAVFFALILAVNIIVIWRMCSSGDPRAVRVMVPNATLKTAYTEAGGDLHCYRQEQATITRAPNNYGYFSVTRCVFIPEAKQVQLVFRYNKSTLKRLAEDKNLQDIPPKSGYYFDVSVVTTTDLTPDDPSDNTDPATLLLTRHRAAAEPVRAETSLYTYFRYTFDGVEVDDLTVGVFADVYYLGDLSYDTALDPIYPDPPYGTLCLWDNASENLPYKLTAADRKAILGE